MSYSGSAISLLRRSKSDPVFTSSFRINSLTHRVSSAATSTRDHNLFPTFTHKLYKSPDITDAVTTTRMASSNPPTSGPTKPPKSKSEPYYSISPLWHDVTPIPQIDLESPSTNIPGVPADTGPALATIMYTPRYSEAMSYLRAVTAANEYSERALALTEDIISMNPAHYTVWLYRFRALRELWGLGGGGDWNGWAGVGADGGGGVSEDVVAGVMQELGWLEGVSERHLKNYQIWYV